MHEAEGRLEVGITNIGEEALDLPVAGGVHVARHAARDPEWTISAEDHEIVAKWSRIQPVVIAAGPWPGDSNSNYVHTLLHFADESLIELDGHVIDGKPYIRDIWHESIGGDRSSCLFAISESLMTLEES